MAIAASDLKFYAAANMPEDDTSTVGGAIDALRQVIFTQLAANDDIEVVSSSASDTTQVVTVYGRDAGGAYVSATATLNGTTAVVLSPATTFERVLRVEMSATAVGTVTVRRSPGGATIYTIPIGERGVWSLFSKSASDPSATKTRYMKVFCKNTHGSLTLTAAKIDLTADPDSRIKFGLAATKDDSATAANRLTAPGGVTFFDDNNAQNVPGTTLEAAAAIGIWAEQALTTGDAPHRTTFTLKASGESV
ncbi:MAG: hypothetical protein IH828_03520 [Nitrospinae bacterium]|nr:hypothetical protein [Nitrospinota bacterium]